MTRKAAPVISWLGFASFLFVTAAAQAAGGETAPEDARRSATIACSEWTLDGYRLGMSGQELLAIRSVTLHVEGQAQVIEPGRFQGALVLDTLNRLQKWDVRYSAAAGDGLRAEMQKRFGRPSSDVSGSPTGSPEDSQRRTIWWSSACDTAIIVYEHSAEPGTRGGSVSASLTRASILTPGILEMKTLFH